MHTLVDDASVLEMDVLPASAGRRRIAILNPHKLYHEAERVPEYAIGHNKGSIRLSVKTTEGWDV